MASADLDIITATIPRFREISGISRSKIYEMLDAGELESVHVGARRLILIDSYRRLIERCRQTAAAAPKQSTARHPASTPQAAAR